MDVTSDRTDTLYEAERAKIRSFVVFNSFLIWGIPLAMFSFFLTTDKEPAEGFFERILLYGVWIAALFYLGIYWPCASFPQYIIPRLNRDNIKEISKSSLRYIWGGLFGAIVLLICSAILAQFSKPFGGCFWGYFPAVLLYTAVFLTRLWYGAFILAVFLSCIPIIGAGFFALLALSFLVLLLERYTTVFSRLGVRLKCKNFPNQ